MGFLVLIAGLLVFLGTHVFVSMRGARAAAMARLGIVGYRIAFSLVSIAGLVLGMSRSMLKLEGRRC